MARIRRILPMLLLTACSGSPEPTQTAPPEDTPGAGGPPLSATVTMTSSSTDYGSGESHSFSPTEATVRVGGTVTWNNLSGVLHNVTFASTGAPSGIADHAGGQNARNFPQVGTFDYHCTNHAGMTGRVVVRE